MICRLDLLLSHLGTYDIFIHVHAHIPTISHSNVSNFATYPDEFNLRARGAEPDLSYLFACLPLSFGYRAGRGRTQVHVEVPVERITYREVPMPVYGEEKVIVKEVTVPVEVVREVTVPVEHVVTKEVHVPVEIGMRSETRVGESRMIIGEETRPSYSVSKFSFLLDMSQRTAFSLPLRPVLYNPSLMNHR